MARIEDESSRKVRPDSLQVLVGFDMLISNPGCG